MPFPLAPLPEQCRIVERIESLFSKLDAAKSKAQAVIDGSEKRRTAILHRAFTGELTKKWREKNLSSKWKLVRFSEVVDLISGRDEPLSNCNNKRIGVPYIIGASNLENNSFTVKRWIEKTHVISKRGDILISVKGTIGKVYLQTEDVINISRQIMAVRPSSILMPKFVYLFLISVCDELRKVGRGLIPGISRKDILDILFPSVSLSEQREIVRILDSLLTKEQQAKKLAENVLKQIDMMKKSILARAFRGELGTNNPNDEPASEFLKIAQKKNI